MRPTLIVRQVMQQHGKRFVYTNLYDECHTVKCYQSINDDEMISDIKRALDRNKVEHTIKKRTNSGSAWRGLRSIIVRIPK